MSLLVAALPATLWAATFVVDTTADTVDTMPGDGVCADASAHCSLRGAVQEANSLSSTDLVLLPTATFGFTLGGSDNTAAAGDLDVTSGVLVVRGTGASTIIDAQGLDRVFEQLGGSLVLQDLTVTGGLSSGSICGAGINQEAGTLVLKDVQVVDNTCLDTGYPTSRGGGARLEGTATIQDSFFSGNTAGLGGALAVRGGTATVTNTVVDGNGSPYQTNYGGGAVVELSGTLSCEGCTFTGNIGYLGGALNTGAGATATLVDSDVVGNDSSSAAIYSGGGDIVLETTLVAGNVGWGIEMYSGALDLENVTVSGNSSGGIYQTYGAGSLRNVTVAENTGTGVRVEGLALMTMVNTVLAKNVAGSKKRDCTGTITSSGHNFVGSVGPATSPVCSGFISGDTTGTGASPAAALIGPLLGRGHWPMATSPLVDNGGDTSCAAVDVFGRPRPEDGDGDGVATCDIGSVER